MIASPGMDEPPASFALWGICDYSQLLRLIAGYLSLDSAILGNVHPDEASRVKAAALFRRALAWGRWRDLKPRFLVSTYEISVRRLRKVGLKHILPFYEDHPGEFFPKERLDEIVPVCL